MSTSLGMCQTRHQGDSSSEYQVGHAMGQICFWSISDFRFPLRDGVDRATATEGVLS